MTHTYLITGMTCTSCEEKVRNLLSQVEGVDHVMPDKSSGEVAIGMKRHLSTEVLQNALSGTRYAISNKPEVHSFTAEEKKTWLQTYKPVLVLFAFITGISFLSQIENESFSWMLWMRHFMSAFFLSFSFFKMLNLSGFADSYSTYDIIAKRWRAYGYIYAFIELALGLAFFLAVSPLFVNLAAFLVMSISLIGVLQSVLNKRKIKCACLGDVFNLPMSTLTIIEDALMMLMSLFMIVYLIS